MQIRTCAFSFIAFFGLFVGAGANAAGYHRSSGYVGLTASSYAVAQSAGNLSVSVTRTGGSRGSASVSYQTNPLTTLAGDFTAANGSLTWASGDWTPKTFQVSVNNATPFNGTRTFQITLAGAAGATMGSPSVATVTITGSGATASTVALSAATYAAAQTGGGISVTVNRAGGSVGAVNVNYATSNGTAAAGTNYTAATGTLNWASGDTLPKTISVPVMSAPAFSGSKTFTFALSAPSGATLSTPSSAVATINGSASTAGTIALSAASYAVGQAGGTVNIPVNRTGGSTGAVTVAYATANGTASAGSDYTAKSGTLSWAAADTASKTVSIAVSNATPFTGTRTFALALSAATGGATLGSPNAAITTITGSGAVTACARNSGSWVTAGIFDAQNYGNYVVNNNNWGGTSGQQLWVNNQSCWGVTTTATSDRGGIGSYPSVTRGWTQNQTVMQQLSTAGTEDWTTKSGMGIPVGQLTKARLHWAFTAPTTTGIRWMALQDIYFHKSASPAATEFPPVVDLMIDQSLADQIVGNSTYYALVAGQNHAATVTIGGNLYVVYVDSADEASFHQAGGHNIHLFNLPTAFTSGNNNGIWGTMDGVTDIAAIVTYFKQSNPRDDAGQPLKNAAGAVITSPIITSNLFLNAINAGWEIDDGTVFSTTALCIAMQNEPDCQ